MKFKQECDVFGKACFREKMFTNGLNMGLHLRTCLEKKQSMEWKHIEPV